MGKVKVNLAATVHWGVMRSPQVDDREGAMNSHNHRGLHSNSFQLTFGFQAGLKFVYFVSFFALWGS